MVPSSRRLSLHSLYPAQQPPRDHSQHPSPGRNRDHSGEKELFLLAWEGLKIPQAEGMGRRWDWFILTQMHPPLCLVTNPRLSCLIQFAHIILLSASLRSEQCLALTCQVHRSICLYLISSSLPSLHYCVYVCTGHMSGQQLFTDKHVSLQKDSFYVWTFTYSCTVKRYGGFYLISHR